MKYCSDCGEKISLNQKFCPGCGKQISNDANIKNQDNSTKLTCPYCGSDNIQVQIVSQNKNAGCLMVFIYVLLALTIVGIPIMILILLLKGKKSVNHKYYVCQNCGKTFNPKLNFAGANKNQNQTAVIISVVIIIIAVIAIGVTIGLKDSDYVNFDQYQPLDAQTLHNDYLDNEISAKSKYEGNYYYFTGEIYDITQFLNDKYLELRYTSSRDNSQKIELNAYFSDSNAFTNLKKGDTVTVYCKFKERSIEDYLGITSYSFHSCQFKNEKDA